MNRALALLAVMPACFGEGPMPTAPTGATTVFYVNREASQPCGTAWYIGDVALGDEDGYALTYQWYPPNNCGGGGGNQNTYEVPVHRFDKLGGDTEMIGMAGKTSGAENARLAALGSSVAWAYDNANTSMTAMPVGGVGFSGMLPYSGSAFSPVAMTADPTGIYVIGHTFLTGTNINNPSYPCCDTGSPGGEPMSRAWKLEPTATTGTGLAFAPTTFYSAGLKSGLSSNDTTLFYLQRADTTATTPVTVHAVPKATMQSTQIATLERSDGIPVGFGANNAALVWSLSVSYATFPVPSPRCKIVAFDLASGEETTLLETPDFSCLDAAVDDTHVYFAIVHVDSDNDSHQTSPYGMAGHGIGRVSLANGTLETLDHGIRGELVGPRRIYLDGDEMYVVDPFTIAKIAKSVLDGGSDF